MALFRWATLTWPCGWGYVRLAGPISPAVGPAPSAGGWGEGGGPELSNASSTLRSPPQQAPVPESQALWPEPACSLSAGPRSRGFSVLQSQVSLAPLFLPSESADAAHTLSSSLSLLYSRFHGVSEEGGHKRALYLPGLMGCHLAKMIRIKYWY